MIKNPITRLLTGATLCVLLGCLNLAAPQASAQGHRMDRGHSRTVIVHRSRPVVHHRRRVVQNVRVRRNGHWVTVRRVIYR